MPQNMQGIVTRTKLPSGARGWNFSLSPAALAVVGCALVLMLGWCFYMGFMIGRGQNPEEHMARIAALWHEDQGRSAAEPATPQTAGPVLAQGEAGQQAQDQDQSQAQGQEMVPGQPPRVTGYPVFTTQGGQPGQAQLAQAQQPRQEQAPAQSPKPQVQPQSEPGYTFVYRMATVRSQADAREEQDRYEGKGFRVSIRKLGNAWALQHTFKGTDADAKAFLQRVKKAGLGEPLRISRKKN